MYHLSDLTGKTLQGYLTVLGNLVMKRRFTSQFHGNEDVIHLDQDHVNVCFLSRNKWLDRIHYYVSLYILE